MLKSAPSKRNPKLTRNEVLLLKHLGVDFVLDRLKVNEIINTATDYNSAQRKIIALYDEKYGC